MTLSADMVRGGFQKFPQSEAAWVSPAVWPQIAPIEIATGYPFKAFENSLVPPGELWFVGANDVLLGRIINIGNPT
jgi:hypothetical protein